MSTVLPRSLRCAAHLAIPVLLLLIGCRPHDPDPDAARGDDDHGHSHDHESEIPPVLKTAHSDRFEVFVEFPPPVAGEPSRFLAHVTDLATGEPWSQPGLRYRFRQGADSWETNAPPPSPPGIVSQSIVFPKDGPWDAAVLLPGTPDADLVPLGEIRVAPDARQVVKAGDSGEPEGIPFSKERQWRLGLRTAPVRTAPVSERVRASGTVTAVPGTLAQVASPVPGLLQAPDGGRIPSPGDPVTQGQVLATVRPTFSEATAKLGEIEGQIADARLDRAQALREVERVRSLVDSGIESRRALELAQLDADAAQARLEAAQATQTSYRTGHRPAGEIPLQELRSPLNGILVAVPEAAPGQWVPAERRLFTVLQPGPVQVEARVPEAAAERLGPAPGALLETPGRRGTFRPVADEGGRLRFASPLVDPETHSVTFVYELPNRDGRLRIGEHLTVFLESATATNALVIPGRAVVEDAGQPVAFVQTSGETFQRRELVLGIRDGDRVAVLRGLKPGERVVTDGANLVRLTGLGPAQLESGHVH